METWLYVAVGGGFIRRESSGSAQIPPVVVDWLPQALAGHESYLLTVPGCRRSDVYDNETLNLAIKVGKRLILGHQFVQRSRKAKRASLSGLATFLRPREEGPALSLGRHEMLHPKLDRPIFPGHIRGQETTRFT